MLKLLKTLLLALLIAAVLCSASEDTEKESDLADFIAYAPNLGKEGEKFHFKDEAKILTLFEKRDFRLAVLIHGFKSDLSFDIFPKLKDTFFSIPEDDLRPDYVILVDWRKQSNFKLDFSFGYVIAAQNTLIIGNQLAGVLDILRLKRNVDPQNMHLIGFSLGAHVAGFAARNAILNHGFPKKIGRISGIDPAGPRFENYMNHLNKDDGAFVDIIHANGGNNILRSKLGMMTPVGHVDFYPNGGSRQCKNDLMSCSHNTAPKYYEASIRNRDICTFQAVKCESYEQFTKDFKSCDDVHLNITMGFYSFQGNPRGNYYLDATELEPFCIGKGPKANFGSTHKEADTSYVGAFISVGVIVALFLLFGALYWRRENARLSKARSVEEDANE